MLKPRYSNQFKKDYKLAIKRGKDESLFIEVLEKLIKQEPLPAKKTKTTSFLAIGQNTGNVIFSRTGCSFILSIMMNLYWNCLGQVLIQICLEDKNYVCNFKTIL